ncbi:glycoside hydrolase family 128 protein [Xylariaceae sp. FL1019]|nr:glycoside hydrolase family 128 protein [Xylariaceae sp. FL1019]
MHSSLTLLAAFSGLTHATTSTKRGLVHITDTETPVDNSIWVQSGSDLTWYYNYGSQPSSAYTQSQSDFEFVPMLWGSIDDTSFLDNVTSLVDGGRNISHVLTFNEPDLSRYGGSNVSPAKAAQIWVDNIAPLRKTGIKVGLPACTGADTGITWLQNFLANCSALISTGDETKNCTYDFVAIHWYGDFGGLASHMGEYSAAFPNVSQWITEYNYDNQDLDTTQDFYNTSSEYFDRLDSVGRYSYFGSFRSDVSNVGPNAVMLNNDGELTDVGSWYLGGSATGVDPQSMAAGRVRISVLGVALAIFGGLVLL